jgi:hypothetical protein
VLPPLLDRGPLQTILQILFYPQLTGAGDGDAGCARGMDPRLHLVRRLDAPAVRCPPRRKALEVPPPVLIAIIHNPTGPFDAAGCPPAPANACHATYPPVGV